MKVLIGLIILLQLLQIQASFRGNRIYQGPKRDGSYSFSYRVLDDASGNDFGHEESRTGTDTSGEYHVLLPDGRVQKVRYNVDPYSGYRAFISYEGKSIKPRPVPSFIRDPVRTLESIRRDPTVVKPPKGFLPPPESPVYKPINYLPAHVDYPSRPIVNLIVPEEQRHRPFLAHAPRKIKPIDPRKKNKNKNGGHHKKDGLIGNVHKHDPYLATEEELRGRDFSGPFFYPKHRKISKEGTKRTMEGKKRKMFIISKSNFIFKNQFIKSNFVT
ncbi:uncharacterized protein [Lepeophtheirus salmonis]|uniref:uncharacterized protein n=1 Tax=Lepeophtheirus salmonis TaxID=72036 RepID=UPI003AF3324E